MSKIKFIIEVEQDDTPVRGNAMVSGDDQYDRQVEDKILKRLRGGDVWAWALVTVKVVCGNLEATEILGGCSYKDEADFRKCATYHDMRLIALEDLKGQIEALVEALPQIQAEHDRITQELEALTNCPTVL